MKGILMGLDQIFFWGTLLALAFCIYEDLIMDKEARKGLIVFLAFFFLGTSK